MHSLASWLVMVVLVWAQSRYTEGSCSGIEHNCSQICIKISDSFICDCFHGYRLARDRSTCLDIDECMEYRPCHQLCENTNGSFECSCHDGYTFDIDSRECMDINECLDPSTCVIDGTRRACVNLPGGFQCIEEIISKDHQSMLFHTELEEISEPVEEHENVTETKLTTSTTVPTTPKTAGSTFPNTTPNNQPEAPSPNPKCPKRDKESDDGISIGSAFSSYQLSIIAGCFITAIGLIVVFVIVFFVAQWRRKQLMESRGLMDSPGSTSPTSSSSLTTTSPSHQLQRNYARKPHRRSAHRWRPYAQSDFQLARDRKAGTSDSRAAGTDVSNMAASEKRNYALKEDGNNNALIPALV